ncbi:YraN family protein [Microbacterium hominis]|uniref:UPF0102 protein HQM25_07835 n=1 Tax=Microbacterium hominis TaxID=162426 RepID=A0A7D4UI45_9MICO|nr:YraN family protein [Microbacterium hominis]QKJ19288.1 YraN family protein [Microbacterium hominis]
MADKDALGRAGEDRAARHMEAAGYTVLARNWRCREGEIDLVVASASELVVVEVKTRRGVGYGHPLLAVDTRKRRRMWRVAMAWIADHPSHAQGRRLRLDAVGIVGPDPRSGALEHLCDLDLM